MHFFYDAQSKPAMVEFNGAVYNYVHNLQGDIVGIVDSAGSLVVEYKYDAWGKPTLVRTLTTAYEALAELNPFRYRGYVYDEETGLYYLRSRYYNLLFSRFLNMDSHGGHIGVIGIHAYFTYCANNPICFADYNGTYTILTTLEDVKKQLEAFVAAVTEHQIDSTGYEFSILSVEEKTITEEEAAISNKLVKKTSGLFIGFVAGLLEPIPQIGGLLNFIVGDLVGDELASPIGDAYSVNEGTYASVVFQYKREFKTFGIIPGHSIHTYEIRLYSDYCEIWYQRDYMDHLNDIYVPFQKIGSMSLDDVNDILGID